MYRIVLALAHGHTNFLVVLIGQYKLFRLLDSELNVRGIVRVMTWIRSKLR